MLMKTHLEGQSEGASKYLDDFTVQQGWLDRISLQDQKRRKLCNGDDDDDDDDGDEGGRILIMFICPN